MEATIQQTLEKAKKNRLLYQKSEPAVRDHLINPMLNELGWHTDDPDFVIPNLRSDEAGIPDYTLKNHDRIVTYIEAKNLACNLNDDISQLARYCNNQGTEFGILTNGLQWMLLKTFEKGTKLSDRIVWEIDFQKDDKATVTKRLSSISYQNIDGLAAIVEKDKMLQLVWDTFLAKSDSLLGSLVDVFADHFQTKHPTVNFDMEDVRTFFNLKLKNLLTNQPEEGQRTEWDDDNDNNGLRVKTPSPSASKWRQRVPELAKFSKLHSWKAICDHLKIVVGGASARLKLKMWVREHKPNWPEVPDPQKQPLASERNAT